MSVENKNEIKTVNQFKEELSKLLSRITDDSVLEKVGSLLTEPELLFLMNNSEIVGKYIAFIPREKLYSYKSGFSNEEVRKVYQNEVMLRQKLDFYYDD